LIHSILRKTSVLGQRAYDTLILVQSLLEQPECLVVLASVPIAACYPVQGHTERSNRRDESSKGRICRADNGNVSCAHDPDLQLVLHCATEGKVAPKH
jgi:hypothetical protein